MEIPISWRSLGTFDFSPSFLSCSPWRCVIPWVCPTPSHRQKGPPAFLHAHCDKRSRLGWSTEAGVEIVFDVSTRKKWLQKGTKLTYNKRAIWIYFGFPSIFFFFFQKLAKSFLLIASIVSGKNCFWMTSVSFNRILPICSHGVAFPMSEFRSQLVRKFAQQILSNPSKPCDRYPNKQKTVLNYCS